MIISTVTMKSLSIFAFLLVVLSLHAFAGVRGLIVGGYKPMNIKDPKVKKMVKEMGKFAVSEYNKESSNSLEFVKVVKAEEQVVAGTNYRLHVEAKEGNRTQTYEAILFRELGENFEKLVSFKPIPLCVGCWEPIKNITDPYVQCLGDFSVNEYNHESNSNLKFVKVVKGEQQLVAGMNYRLLVEAKVDSASRNYSAFVFVPVGQKLWKLVSFNPMYS